MPPYFSYFPWQPVVFTRDAIGSIIVGYTGYGYDGSIFVTEVKVEEVALNVLLM